MANWSSVAGANHQTYSVHLATARWTNLVVEQGPAWSASSKDDDVVVVDDSSCTSLTDEPVGNMR